MNPERHQQVMEVLAAAVECDTGDRERVLDQRCAGDEPLRKEIERLIKYQKQSPQFLEESLVEKIRQLKLDEQQSLIGKHVGSYRLTAIIGRGGMGAVYRAIRDDDEYHRQVAIKVIKPGMDSTLILRRFRNERQILATLDHQNIARLYDGGTTADGLPYLVMEYIEGAPIHDFANTRRLSITDRLKLFLSVCEAVDYAHRRQVVHSDLKPANILVTNEGVPKLLDFGIAKVVYSEASAITTDTTLSALRGMTPEYASPEQLRGERLTIASDVYSLGVLLYELLTGHRPYDLRQASPYEIAQIVCRVEPEKPSSIVTRIGEPSQTNGEASHIRTPESASSTRGGTPEQLRNRLSGDLDTIVLKALRKEPERRYASAAQFAEDIQRHFGGLPILARKDIWTYRGFKFMTRHRKHAMITSIVSALCLIFGVSLSGIIGIRNNSRAAVVASLPPQTVSDCVTPPSQMISWWLAEENGYDAQGVNFGAMENGASFAQGKVGQAFHLNAAKSQFVRVPDSKSLRVKQGTLDAWVNFDSVVGGGCCNSLFGKTLGDGTHDSYAVWYTNNALHGGVCNLEGCTVLAYPWGPTTGKWYHIAYTFNSSTHKLFVDGVETAGGANTREPSYDSHDFLIGADVEDTRPNLFFDGKIDEVDVFNRSLTETEIKAIFDAGSYGKCRVPSLSSASNGE